MATETQTEGSKASISTTNFDTYTLILQLGCILNTVPAWKKAYKLRVVVFVEFESDVEEERQRVNRLLTNLRIQAEVLVIWLASGKLRSYETIVRGVDSLVTTEVNRLLRNEIWWEELKATRKRHQGAGTTSHSQIAQLMADSAWPSSSYQQAGRSKEHPTSSRLKRLLQRRRSLPGAARPGVPQVESLRAHRRSVDLSSDMETENACSSDSEDENEASGLLTGHGRDYGTNREGTDAVVRPHESASHHRTARTRPAQDVHACNQLTPRPSGLPLLPSRPSTPHFSCTAIPETQVIVDEGSGPTIRFADDVTSTGIPSQSASTGASSSRLPPLSFNDVPSRGQHIILNELFRKHSEKTAVIFTTLPSPTRGACKSEQESLDYLLDLEVSICRGFQ